jgi:hypothetical protein
MATNYVVHNFGFVLTQIRDDGKIRINRRVYRYEIETVLYDNNIEPTNLFGSQCDAEHQ